MMNFAQIESIPTDSKPFEVTKPQDMLTTKTYIELSRIDPKNISRSSSTCDARSMMPLWER